METKFKYFSITNQQLQLLRASLMRSLAKFAEVDDMADDVQRTEAMEIETVRAMLENISETDRPVIRILLTVSQFNAVRLAVKTMQLTLEERPSLKEEYATLIMNIETGHLSRPESARQEDMVKETA
jgi:hypothetical protein